MLDVASRPVVQPRTQRTRSTRILQLGLASGDLVVIVVATVLAVVGRSRLTIFRATDDVTEVAQSVGVWIVLAWMVVNLAVGTYQRSHLGVGTTEYAKVLAAAGMTAGLIGIISYLTKFNLSRGFFVLLFVVGVPLLLLWRWTARRLVHRLHLRGHLLTKVLIAGSAHHVDEVAAVLDRESWLGYRIVGALLPPTQALGVTPRGVPVLGLSTDTALATLDHEADLVVFTEGAFQSSTDFRRIAWDLEGHHVQMAVVPSLSDISSGRIMMRPIGGLPLVHVEQPQSLGASRGLKRTFDVVGAGVSLLLCSPIMLAVAVAIKLQDGGPVLFRQTRVGRDGELFECLKFRSMVVDAEARLSAVTHLKHDPEHVLFKAQTDPRVTPVGRFIRRFSIDELPQLANVIAGEMSLVGPRPALPAEVRRYSPDVQRRLHVRPGMTGLWQVSGRSDLPWEDTVRLDLYYVDNWSLVQDLSIVIKTIRAVLSSRGAY
ncbi:sugar transferase [Intrasporangium sp.]|uniref:sugar transferase n=1 Tax=Intrasporangium sp. TaxID=1925024 RepID=UPI002939B0FE|nr:sugar transferase [Intrasporangium sp.]MDV3222372.1 sugar transferase [Intrasporangium sp.]